MTIDNYVPASKYHSWIAKAGKKLSPDYAPMIMEVANRAVDQAYEEMDVFNPLAAVYGLDYDRTEGEILSEFATYVQRGVATENLTEHQFLSKIQPHKIKGLIGATVLYPAWCGLFTYLVTQDPDFVVGVGIAGISAGLAIEKIYRSFSAISALTVPRKRGSAFPKKNLEHMLSVVDKQLMTYQANKDDFLEPN